MAYSGVTPVDHHYVLSIYISIYLTPSLFFISVTEEDPCSLYCSQSHGRIDIPLLAAPYLTRSRQKLGAFREATYGVSVCANPSPGCSRSHRGQPAHLRFKEPPPPSLSPLPFVSTRWRDGEREREMRTRRWGRRGGVYVSKRERKRERCCDEDGCHGN